MSPVLWSFRRCPYAMRARLALEVSGVRVHLREVVLQDKPAAFLRASPGATVPCLQTDTGVIDESLDIMIWALRQNDPEGWLHMPPEGFALIKYADGPFKEALDRTKYETRYPGSDPEAARQVASEFLQKLDAQTDDWLFGRPSLADFAILPFVRQFAFIDKARFDAGPWPRLQGWLASFLASQKFAAVMHRYPRWQDGMTGDLFPDPATISGTGRH
ncbi:glutathione S-transferase [Roseobacter sp.]|uniref:glutathione S-transferase n=1 Tax=Roseobacter sp. TaxID=1907202 RepID=UPI0025E98E4F|nr:glutathione S-transferase [Roseobacter sp.]